MYVKGRLFDNVEKLEVIYSDTYAYCCIKPSYMKDADCHAPLFDVSSCTDLIENPVLRAFLWMFGLSAFFGNIAVVFYRIYTKNKGAEGKTYSIYVTNLGLSDALMGVYMLIIAKTDALFAEYEWRHGTLCMVSGIICVSSSEFSAILVSLISIDSKYPFGGIRMSIKFARFLTIFSFVISIKIGVIPVAIDPGFYSRSGVCIGLPLTGGDKTGMEYLLAVFFGFNHFIPCDCFVSVPNLSNYQKTY
ncbi:hypothetical protein KUTeg_023852 [Tegillarca granosa]|uniref:G-protein coupled receptors family 1 profile domain-containing protein n=1 Tax=Tegillarca granosa TaxID=220873 RepID=A0ABQ9E7D3_TEGGR|nr:hypothetical protein KUTeg_023852 [Tegillarca granosa]